MSRLARWLGHPLTRGLALDDPLTTRLRREIIRSKPYLRRVYLDWYARVRESLPPVPGAVLELGSGAGFLPDVIPEAITSDISANPGVRVIADGRELPFGEGTLRAIILVDVLHHVPDCRLLFAEAARCVRPGGVLVAIEPWVTPWSRFVYERLHHEPFQPGAARWEFPSEGPLSGANQALPWIIFERDRAVFERSFPAWRITGLKPFMPLAYLASGGLGMRSGAPGWAYPIIEGLEKLAEPVVSKLAMFAHVVLRRAPV